MTVVDSDTAAAVALLRLGTHGCIELIERAGSATAALERELDGGGAQTTLLRPDPEPLLEEAARSVEAWAAQGIEVVTVLDVDYPPNLRRVHDRPLLVFVSGALTAEDERSVAVIGARQASRDGRMSAGRVAAELVEAGYTVLSGLAAGVDTAAHEAALSCGGRTVAVVGTGLMHCYPPENAALQRQIMTRGAVVSQFLPASPPQRRNFPLRNAVMSGLSRGSVVVEASERSGARVQARLARAHGRPVFLLERVLEQPWARELAERDGVHVVSSAREVIAVVDEGLNGERARE